MADTVVGDVDFLANGSTLRDPHEYAKLQDFKTDYARWRRRSGDGHRFSRSPVGSVYAFIRRLFLPQRDELHRLRDGAYRIPDEWRATRQTPVTADIARQFAIFDDLSTYYGELYRGAAALSYLLSAAAVALALYPIFVSESSATLLTCAIAECLVMIVVMIIYARGRTPTHSHGASPRIATRLLQRRWHERWLEYRVLAERFRYLSLLLTVGVTDPSVPGRNGVSTTSWVDAYFLLVMRREQRQQRPPDAFIWPRIALMADEQYAYHLENAETNNRIVLLVTRVADLAFAGAFLAVLVHLAKLAGAPYVELPDALEPLTIFATAWLPALAAALHGIVTSGEYHKLAEQSRDMCARLTGLIVRLVEARQVDPTQTDAVLKELLARFWDLVVEEAAGWRGALRDKNVPLP